MLSRKALKHLTTHVRSVLAHILTYAGVMRNWYTSAIRNFILAIIQKKSFVCKNFYDVAFESSFSEAVRILNCTQPQPFYENIYIP